LIIVALLDIIGAKVLGLRVRKKGILDYSFASKAVQKVSEGRIGCKHPPHI